MPIILQIDAAEMIEEEVSVEQRSVSPNDENLFSPFCNFCYFLFTSLHGPKANKFLYCNDFRSYKERLEMLRSKKMELKAAKSSLGSKESKVVNKESSDDESSSDGDSDENLTVDWRAKHL